VFPLSSPVLTSRFSPKVLAITSLHSFLLATTTNKTTYSGFTSSSAAALPTYCRTTENGNIGDIIGPPFIAALNSMLGSSRVAVRGVNDYLADIAGFEAGGSAQEVRTWHD